VHLTLKNDFDNIKNLSMDDALKYLIQPEILKGNNKYECERCNKKVDYASKGQKFKKIPEVLVIQ